MALLRHIALVHSTALRQVGDAYLAQDITQAVFIILARKAGSLGPNTVLSAWLYRTSSYVAAETLRTNRRRAFREQEAYMQSDLDAPQSSAWEQLSPVLDHTMSCLNDHDRTALVLRFFEKKTASEIALLMRTNEGAVQKRIGRAVEKLRKLFNQRGIKLAAAVITASVAANSVQAAPPDLARIVTGAAVTGGVAVSSSTLTIIKGALKIMAWAKAKTSFAVVTASVVAACTATVIVRNTILPAANSVRPGTFVTTSGEYRWANPGSRGELVLQKDKLRSITLGTSQPPAKGDIIVDRWTNAPSKSQLIIHSNEVQFATSDGSHRSSAGIRTWHFGRDWFIYRADGMRVWAYDGDRGLWMLTATPLGGSECSSIEYLQEQPPGAVLKRLPDAVRKSLPLARSQDHVSL